MVLHNCIISVEDQFISLGTLKKSEASFIEKHVELRKRLGFFHLDSSEIRKVITNLSKKNIYYIKNTISDFY